MAKYTRGAKFIMAWGDESWFWGMTEAMERIPWQHSKMEMKFNGNIY